MSTMKFDLREAKVSRQPGMPVIKVIGLGGGGSNAVDYMVRTKVEGVDFLCANTDAQALAYSNVPVRIQIGGNGLGAGANPERGREAAEQDIDQIKEHIRDADMLFITAGMGGGTGTGAAPVVAKIAREMGILTVGVVSKPFSFERRTKVAEAGIESLAEQVDSLITIPNDKLVEVLGKDFMFAKAFDHANEILHGAVQGISEMVTCPGLINVDFEDLRTVMSERGLGMMGVGTATGEDRARKATEKAIANPLLDDIAVAGARGILVNITGGLDFSIGEYNVIGDVVNSFADEDAKVIIGTSIDESLQDEIRVTVVATGLAGSHAASAKKPEMVKPNLQAVQARQEAEREYQQEAAQKPAAMQPAESEVIRPKMAVNAGIQPVGSNSNYLDIPAFLRRQAD
ncbi:cell division protein FtsZ [Thiomicrospira microaerophila]|uniref:cell division protein FtsZ n=1 Tax=Thiomicrospira microaerophila TaxID=406020 RepID=UPI00200BB016|nr:cell division protein FtsZ [Thiomicrospira microaerophila]UQB42631.1 cell division protein FtsZ [Thiomicrospira microaerophila]